MTKLCVLYTNASPESRTAESVLAQADIGYQSIFVNDPAREDTVVPRLLADQGDFPGLELIRWYAGVYGNSNSNLPTRC